VTDITPVNEYNLRVRLLSITNFERTQFMGTNSHLPVSDRLVFLLGTSLGIEVKDYEGTDLLATDILDSIEQKVYGPTGVAATPVKPVEAAPVSSVSDADEAAQFAAFKRFQASQAAANTGYVPPANAGYIPGDANGPASFVPPPPAVPTFGEG
jgi:hypothetical protein